MACPTDYGRWDPDACPSQFPYAVAVVIPGRAQLHRRSTDDVTVGGGGVGDAMKSMSSGALSRIALDVDAPFASPFHDHRAARREEVCQAACIENRDTEGDACSREIAEVPKIIGRQWSAQDCLRINRRYGRRRTPGFWATATAVQS